MTGSGLLWRWLLAFREVNAHGKNFSTAHVGVLMSLATRADPSGLGIYRGVAGLATDTGAKRDTVIAALAKGRDMRVIERRRKARRGSGEADTYALVPPADWCLTYDREHPRERAPF